jgi:hypothetical protein
MPYDFDSPVIDASHFDAGAEINAVLRDHDNARIAGDWLNVRTTIWLNAYKELYCETPSTLLKQFNGPILVMRSGGFQKLDGTLGFNGQANVGFTGDNIYVEPGGGWQKFNSIRSTNCNGYAVHMEQAHAGHMASFYDCLLQCADRARGGLKLPESEPTTGGVRRLVVCSGGGAMLCDIAGSNVTMMIACDTYDFRFGEASNYGVFVANRFAMPYPLHVRGWNHRFLGNVTSHQVHVYNPSIDYQALGNYDAGFVKHYSTMAAAQNQLGMLRRPGKVLPVVKD